MTIYVFATIVCRHQKLTDSNTTFEPPSHDRTGDELLDLRCRYGLKSLTQRKRTGETISSQWNNTS